jgi:hypothetical protein
MRYSRRISSDIMENLFKQSDTHIDKYVLQGEFETQRSGRLEIFIDLTTQYSPRTIWTHCKQKPLSASNLFHGIFNMLYRKRYGESFPTSKATQLSQVLNEAFKFIDDLFNGSIRLQDMTDLKTVFCDKNIHVQEEVQRLFTYRLLETSVQQQLTTANMPTEQNISQVCEWLRIYQYYSYINIILDCIAKFEILKNDDDDQLIVNLKELSNKNCSLKEITDGGKILLQKFKTLKSQHLQLIKITSECSVVIQIMKDFNLYTVKGRRRFQELQDNLTTQFQLQERNSTLLNSWIIVHALCEPFTLKAKTLDEFIARLAGLSQFEESSLAHMRGKNDSEQIV